MFRKDVNFAVEAQEKLLLSEDGNSRVITELDMNVVSEICLGDTSQMLHEVIRQYCA